jgi:hypothetical protein
MPGNYIGSGVVNGIPVNIGGPGATPIPASARPAAPVTASNQPDRALGSSFVAPCGPTAVDTSCSSIRVYIKDTTVTADL